MIHPGSTHLHIGLSTDPTPHSIPHVIAYRKKGVATEGGGVVREEEGSEKRDESLVLKHCNEITVSLSYAEAGVCGGADKKSFSHDSKMQT